MMSCKEVARLASESLDRTLSWRQRIAVRLHLLMCRLCAGFRSDLVRLRKAARRHAEDVEKDTGMSDVTLSREARERIQRALESQDR